jgi:two-component system chemotaxis response regulator CheY
MARILIIDDDESLRTTLEQWLTAAGHSVLSAADPLDGLQLFRAAPTDLVVMDMMMPHSGLSAIRVLRGQYPQVRVIAMTGGPQHRLGYARDLGASHTLVKPFTPEQLKEAIAGALGARPEPPTV